PLQEDFSEFLASAVAVTRQAQTAINELDELLESGFKGREIDIVFAMIRQLDTLEMAADGCEREIRHKLQALETSYHTMNAMFLYMFIDYIDELANTPQQVGSRLLLLLAR